MLTFFLHLIGAVQTLPAFGGEDPVLGRWHHEHITWQAARRAGWKTAEGPDPDTAGDQSSAAAALAWHADYVDSYLYNPLWWSAGGPNRIRAALLTHDELEKVHFDDLTSPGQVRMAWDRCLAGTVVGLLWAATENDIDAARHITGVGLHMAQDFYSHSNWVDDPRRRDRTWFQYREGRERQHLYTGTYVLPDHLGFKPHGKPAPDCTLLKRFLGPKVMDVVCSPFSPLTNTGLCQRWTECRSSEPAEVEVISGVTIPDGWWMVDPGIALDSTWQAEIAARHRDLPSAATGRELFAAALQLAEDHTVQWLRALERLMHGLGHTDFWQRVKTQPRGERQDFPLAPPELATALSGYGPDLRQYEDSSRMLYTFLSAGKYPPAPGEDADSWYLRLELETAADPGAGTSADIFAEGDGFSERLDHMHRRTPGGGIDEFRLLEFDDFEAGRTTAYVLGPYAQLPLQLTLRNSAAGLTDIVTAAWRDLVRAVGDLVDSVGDFLLSVIAGHPDVVAGDKLEWDWDDLNAAAGAGARSFQMDFEGGEDGRFRVDGHLDVRSDGDGLMSTVTLERLLCIKESGGDRFSESDEPFALVLLSSPASGQLKSMIAGPYSNVDTGEVRDIGKSLTVRVPKYGGLLLPVALMESDDETSSYRNRKLEQFKSRYGADTANERSELLDAIGRALWPDWQLESMSVCAFRRTPVPELTWLARRATVRRWIRDGESYTVPLTPTENRRAEVPWPNEAVPAALPVPGAPPPIATAQPVAAVLAGATSLLVV